MVASSNRWSGSVCVKPVRINKGKGYKWIIGIPATSHQTEESNKVMQKLNAFFKERALATRSAQIIVALIWVWLEKTVAQWTTHIDAFLAQEEAAADANAVADARRSELDAKLEEVHQRTQQGLSFFKTACRNDVVKTGALRSLTAIGNSRALILEEALSFEAAWEELDPTWEPMTGQTLALFKVLREEGETCMEAYVAAKAAWRHETEGWNRLGEVIGQDCIAWYSVATQVFPEGTPEGDMIRGTVPTTTGFTHLPEQAVVVLDEVVPGGYSVSLEAEHASKFDVFEKLDGELEYTKVGTDVPSGLFSRTGLTPGGREVKAEPRNSRGAGPMSDALGLTVP